MSKREAGRVYVWRAFCGTCRFYLVAHTYDPRAVESLECPDCKRRCPATRGTVFRLAGEKVATRAFWPEKKKG